MLSNADKEMYRNRSPEFRYQLLSMFQVNVDGFLKNGVPLGDGGTSLHDVKYVTESMKMLWDSFGENEKPDWITFEKIEEYEKNMIFRVQAKEISLSASDLSKREQLSQRIEQEYKAFVDNLMSKPPQMIIDGAYEKVVKEELVSMCSSEESFLSDEEIEFISKEGYPLDALYERWMKSDVQWTAALEDAISYSLEKDMSNSFDLTSDYELEM